MTNRLSTFMGIIAVCCEKHTELLNPLYGQTVEFFFEVQRRATVVRIVTTVVKKTHKILFLLSY